MFEGIALLASILIVLTIYRKFIFKSAAILEDNADLVLEGTKELTKQLNNKLVLYSAESELDYAAERAELVTKVKADNRPRITNEAFHDEITELLAIGFATAPKS